MLRKQGAPAVCGETKLDKDASANRDCSVLQAVQSNAQHLIRHMCALNHSTQQSGRCTFETGNADVSLPVSSCIVHDC